MAKTFYGPEEKKVIMLLDNYGPLYVDQIVRYFPDRGADAMRKMLENLVAKRRVYKCGMGTLTLDPRKEGENIDNEKKQMAFWLLLSLIEHNMVNANNHIPASEPAQICFFRDGDDEQTVYEIVTFKKGTEALVASTLKLTEGIKVLAVADNFAQAEKIIRLVPNTMGVATVNTKFGRNSVTNDITASAEVVLKRVRQQQK